MKKCPNCNSHVDDNDVSCKTCGYHLSSDLLPAITDVSSSRTQPQGNVTITGGVDGEIVFTNSYIKRNPTDIVLQVKIPLPANLTLEEFLDTTISRVKAVEFIYSVISIISSNDHELIQGFLLFIRESSGVSTISSSMLERFLIAANLEPLRVNAIAYGSPASFDLLGIGKILEIVKDLIKDLAWRGKHEQRMADLERRGKQAELEKARLEAEKIALELAAQRLEMEKSALEIANRKLDLVEKMGNIVLAPGDNQMISAVLLPKMLTLSAQPVAAIVRDDLKALPAEVKTLQLSAPH